MQTNNIYLKTINFIDVSNWSVQYLKGTAFSYNKNFEFVKIGDFLIRNKTQIDIEDGKEYKRVTIKMNNGGVFLRDIEKGENIGTKKQFLVKKGQFLLSKIDARGGAFGVIPNEVDGSIITGNFWTFDVDYSKVNPHFLSSLVTTKEFILFCENASNGTTNRHYLQEDSFLNVKIPLPSLEKQNEIVELYNKKLQDSLNAENKALELEKEIENYLMEELGIEIREKEEKKVGLNFVEFKDLDIWGFENTYLTLNNIFKNTKYKKYRIENLCDIGSGGTPNRSNNDYYGGNIPWIKTGEVRENIIYDTEEKITQKGLENSSAKIFPKGSLILAMYGATAGRTAKLGIDLTTNQACAVLYNIDNSIIDTDFLWIYLQSQIENFKFISTGSAQPNLSAEKIKRYPLPLPPLEIQEKIVKHIGELKDEIKRLKSLSEELKESAKIEFEREIFS